MAYLKMLCRNRTTYHSPHNYAVIIYTSITLADGCLISYGSMGNETEILVGFATRLVKPVAENSRPKLASRPHAAISFLRVIL
jgi:hypothetical protein